MSRSLAIAVAALVAAAACAGGSSTSKPADTSPIIVAGLLPETGSASSFGQGELISIQMAIDEINAKGGLLGGRKIQFVHADSRGTSTGAVAGWQQLVAQKPVAIVGPILTAEVSALVQLADQTGIPLLEGSATQELEAGNKGSQWFFRMTETYRPQLRAQVAYAMKTIRPKRPAIISSNDELGKSYAPLVQRFFQENGIQIVSQQTADNTVSDFTAQILATKAANPDVVYFTNLISQSATFAKQVKPLGLNVPMYSGSAMLNALHYAQLTPLDAVHPSSIMTAAAFPAGDPINKGAAPFARAYKAKAGKDVNDVSTVWYAATLVLANAIEKAGSTKPDALAKALRATKGFHSWKGIDLPTGAYTCDPHQNCLNTTLLLGIKNGSIQVIDVIEDATP
jgi:branched-chain amino acid transport system substrate-binding protein